MLKYINLRGLGY